MMKVERDVWRKMAIDTYKGDTLKDLLKKLPEDSNYWMIHLHEKITLQQFMKGGGKGGGRYPSSPSKKGKRTFSQFSPTKTSRPKGKGKGKKGDKPKGGGKKGKGGGKGKDKKNSQGKKADWHTRLKDRDPQGKEYCRQYSKGKCNETNCTRSHNCPVMDSTVWVCNASPGQHKIQECPNLWK